MHWFDISKISASDQYGGIFFLQQDVGELRSVMQQIGGILKSCRQLTEMQRGEIMLVAGEAVSNAIIASYTLSPEKRDEEIFGFCELTAKAFTMRIVDFGKGLYKKYLPDLSQPPGPPTNKKVQLPRDGKLIEHSTTGQGLRILTTLANRFEIELVTEDWKVAREELLISDERIAGTRMSITVQLASEK